MGKLYLFNAAVQNGLVWLALVGVINSVLSAYYYLRVIKTMYLAPAPSDERVPSSPMVRLALGVSALAILALGLMPGPLLDISIDAAKAILPIL